MSAEITSESSVESPLPSSRDGLPVKVRPAVVLVVAYWVAYFATDLLEISNFSKFLTRTVALGALLLLFFIWWLLQWNVPRRERWILLGATAAMGVASVLLLHRSVLPPVVIFLALPAIFTAWTIWLAVARRRPARARRVGMLVIAAIAWAATLLVRMEGLSGGTSAVFHWRWSRSSEELFLAERRKEAAPGLHNLAAALAAPAPPLVAGPGDWPEFRGGSRDAVVSGSAIATNWKESPPEEIWKKRVGPGWSSLTVVGNRLFTQEQRGELEAVISFDTVTGDEVWSHEDKARFSEVLGGDGPRATPTFADGKIYALGATGILNCLDAATGKLNWTRNIADDSGASIPMWGFSSSPLIVDGRAVVFAGGESEQSLLAYNAANGDIAWKGGRGTHSYSSPQLVSLGGRNHLLFVSDVELASLDPATGKTVWQVAGDTGQGQPSIQAHAVGASQLVVSFSPEAGTMFLIVSFENPQWRIFTKWSTMDLKPFFNDFVCHKNSIYGFDGTIFCCVDLETGKRHWKKGRYGAGQVLLLADQDLLLVISEKGEVVLVAADPEQHHELARFQAISGKTWNHPTVVGDRLYVRNAEEMACYRLPLEK